MDIFWQVFHFLIYLNVSMSKIDCNSTSNSNCECFPVKDGVEFQCPASSGTSMQFQQKITVKIENAELLRIRCYGYTDFPNLLPNVTVGKITRLKFIGCPLPPSNTNRIIDHFSLTRVKTVEFQEFNRLIELPDNYFEGLFNVERLELNMLVLSFQGSKIFAGVPNLCKLDMQMNVKLKLKEGIFDNLTQLEYLNLSDDDLEEIPDNVFHSLKSLKVLHFRKNYLKTITGYSFSGLSNLQKLVLRNNEIKSVSNRAFEDLANLTLLDLSYNQLTDLPQLVFKNTKKLEMVFLQRNSNFKLSRDLFTSLISLRVVDLSNCDLKFLPQDILKNSANLEELYLSGNKMKSVPELKFSNLKILNIKRNLISIVNKDAFNLPSLEEINLSGNQIQKVLGAFSKNNLKTINMSKNKYCDAVAHILEGTTDVENIDLSHNCITHIDDFFKKNYTSRLKILNLSYNKISNFQVKNLGGKEALELNLNHNNISYVGLNKINSFRNMSILLFNNSIRCDCKNYDFLQYVRKQKKETSKLMFLEIGDEKCFGTQSEKVVTVCPSLLTCHLNKARMQECVYIWRPFDKSMVLNCTNRNLTTFPSIDPRIINLHKYNQTELHLDINQLTEGPSGNEYGYENITKLFLSRNRIRSVDWLPPKLEELHLNNNHLSRLDTKVLDILNQSNLVSLIVSHNPWQCDCSTANLTKFLQKFSHLLNIQTIHCFNKPKALLVDLNASDLCWQWNHTYYYLVILIIFLSLTLFLILYYRNPHTANFYLYLIFGTECFRPDDFDQHKTYDAFISYSHHDEDFVVKTLVPALEGYQKPYQLCLHYKNWIPGELITTNISNSIQDSHRTVIVLSRNFLESVWSRMEFRTAHSHAMAENTTRVVVIVYGDFDWAEVDEELKVYMNMNTYLKWGDSYFWDKLNYALSRR